MTERISRVFCESCRRNHRYDPKKGSYYAAPREGGFLCSFCPECGSMLPVLNTVTDAISEDLELISKNRKRKLARRLAKVYGLDLRLVLDVSRVLWDVDLKKDYVSMLPGLLNTAFNIKLTEERIRSALE